MLNEYFDKYKLSDTRNVSEERINADKAAVLERVRAESAGASYCAADIENEVYRYGEEIKPAAAKEKSKNRLPLFLRIGEACAAAAVIAFAVPFAVKHIRTQRKAEAFSSEQTNASGAAQTSGPSSAGISWTAAPSIAEYDDGKGGPTAEELGVKYAVAEVDTPVFSAEELVENADLVFTGTVAAVSFRADEDTEIPNGHADICSEFWLSPEHVYKNIGTELCSSVIKVCRYGGIKDKYLNKQLSAIKDSAYPKTIFIYDNAPEINFGETYLFIVKRRNDGLYISTLYQSVYPLSEASDNRYDNRWNSAVDVVKCVGEDAAKDFVNKYCTEIDTQKVSDWWDNDISFYMPEYPDVDFKLTKDKTVTADGELLFSAERSVFLADLNGDGKREICGLCSGNDSPVPYVEIYDYADRSPARKYMGADRIYDSSELFIRDGELYVRDYSTAEPAFAREWKLKMPDGAVEQLPENAPVSVPVKEELAGLTSSQATDALSGVPLLDLYSEWGMPNGGTKDSVFWESSGLHVEVCYTDEEPRTVTTVKKYSYAEPADPYLPWLSEISLMTDKEATSWLRGMTVERLTAKWGGPDKSRPAYDMGENHNLYIWKSGNATIAVCSTVTEVSEKVRDVIVSYSAHIFL